MLAMGAIPPWARVTHNVFPSRVITTETQTEVPAGYFFIWEPPKPNSYLQSITLDWSRLLVQWLAVAFLTAAGLLYFKGSDRKSLKEWWSTLNRPPKSKEPPTT
jgi:hypothetical protein